MTDYRHIAVQPCTPDFVAQVSGIDLSQPLSADALEEIRHAANHYGVLSFLEQHLDPNALQDFSAQLGPFGDDPYVAPMAGFEHIIEVRREARETAPIFGSQWHSDWSFQSTPPSMTILYGAVIPPVGGDTVFADTCRAWNALSPTFQGLLLNLRGVHSAAPAYGPRGLFARDDASRSMRIIVSPEADSVEVHPLVRRHPQSGRRALFVNHVYTVAIEGMHVEESRALLDFLFRHMTRAEFVFRHRWRAHSLLLWDNRRVVHYAAGGYEGHQRLMYRTTLAGERPAA